MDARTLIETAMVGVRIEVCRRCLGLGEIGLPSLRTTCPDCRGRGETTNGVNLNTTGVEP